jgi:DNA-binding response OmpR family regulator/DNA-binding CsgD family transcriptional regulator
VTKPKLEGNLILIVDDSPDTLGMLNDVLEMAKMTTLVALEGKQAISIAQKMKPDVILLDALMPHLDGFETCRRLKADASLATIPVIFMTGLSDTESIVRGFEAGGVDYLTKPINPQELIVRINVHLLNARTTLSAQTALDTVGQNIFAVDYSGAKIWSTPQVNGLLSALERDGFARQLEKDIAQWLSHKPTQGNKLHFANKHINLTAVYFGKTENNEHLIRLIDDNAADETTLIKDYFGITKREAEVCLWIAKGKTNREIARILEMSPRTVNKHLEQLFKKLGVDNRTLAAALAIQCLQKKLP